MGFGAGSFPKVLLKNFDVLPGKDLFGKSDDILTAAERYVQENGTEAFEKLIPRADKPRGSGYIYDDAGYRY